ncbi:hypothetical protein F511_35747 [Dorcoceras hygrometricum]|uniref:Uncharacterized protein n=1 Tax=Dorcoceras hygrometricum TaxID=472368 RepID=A0A2Z7BJC6_9LAMI|nr:hypothetical protein F511_35747 [Dorcoceras hygrometricum]
MQVLNASAELCLPAELFFFDTSPADFTVPVPASSLIGVPAGPRAESLKNTIHKICFWKFGPQCPTSPLLSPRKDPLEDFDGYRTSANTHPHKQHLYGLLDSTMHTSRNCVTNYIHKFNVIVLGRDLFVKDFTLLCAAAEIIVASGSLRLVRCAGAGSSR